MLRRLTAALVVSLAMLASGIGAASAGSRPDTPVLIEAQDKGAYVSVKWRHNTDFAKVEVYRDSRDGKGLQHVTNVSGGNVLNDYKGDPGDIYQLIAYDVNGALSHKSTNRTAEGQSATTRKGVKPSKLEEFETGFKSPARAQNESALRDFKNGVDQQGSWADEEAGRLKAEEWDRQHAEAQKEKERFEREKRRLEQERKDHKSTQDEKQDEGCNSGCKEERESGVGNY